uniref:tetraspanin-2a isoform X1 n=1 Tax=Doryrhamphus excisus TaxID=161450 RepID=UPI0025ADFAEC|nr:tetraspanin-2a isoform X1 [Doryrhamphus excisus]
MSKVHGGMKCVKYLLFVFNFIFWLSGLLVLAVGLWLRFDSETGKLLTGDDAPDTFFVAVYILLGTGGLMMLVGFFGCFGAIRESQCLLASFFACLLIIFAAEIAAGVFGFINKEQIVEEVQKFYSSSIGDVSNPNATAIALMYHKTLNCCGGSVSAASSALCEDAPEETKVKMHAYDVFRPHEYTRLEDEHFMFTCFYHLKDCLSAITDFFNEKLHIIGYVGIGIGGVMILGMIFSMVLCCAIRNSREVI